MPRLEGDWSSVLLAFLAAHPAWQGAPHTIYFADAARGTPEEPWISVEFLRAATRWARQQRYISWEMATQMETLCRRVEHAWASADGGSPA